MYQLPPS